MMSPPLPACASAKLRALASSADEAELLARNALANAEAHEAKIGKLSQQADAHPGEADKLAKERAILEQELETLREYHQRRMARMKNDRQLIAQIDMWLRRLPLGAVLEPVAEVQLEGQGMDDVAEGLADVRARIQSLKTERRNLRALPLPREEIEAKALDYVSRLAAQAAPTLTGIHGEGELALALGPDGRAPLITMAWLAPELLVERIMALVPPGEGSADKLERMAVIEDELLEAQRDEEALVCRAIEQGQDVYRRPRANPAAVLGVRVIVTAAARAA